MCFQHSIQQSCEQDVETVTFKMAPRVEMLAKFSSLATSVIKKVSRCINSKLLMCSMTSQTSASRTAHTLHSM